MCVKLHRLQADRDKREERERGEGKKEEMLKKKEEEKMF